jgi:CheY-like chemotaxis protein
MLQSDENEPGRRILIVDDNEDAADSLATVLRFEGYTVATAYAADAALEHVSSFKPDVLLLDIGLPEMDGYEVARRIRASEEGLSLRIIALTGYGPKHGSSGAPSTDFDAHLMKPVDFSHLTRVLGDPAR